MATSGYSGTPLAKKLGIKPGQNVAFLGEPAGFRRLLAPPPDGVTFTAKGTAQGVAQADTLTVPFR